MSDNSSDSESDHSNAQVNNIEVFSDNEAGSDAENENFGEQADFYMPLSDQPDRLSDSEDDTYISSPGDVKIEQLEAESDVKFAIESNKIEEEIKELKKLSAEKRVHELNKKALADFNRRYYEEVENSIAGNISSPKLLDPLPKGKIYFHYNKYSHARAPLFLFLFFSIFLGHFFQMPYNRMQFSNIYVF